MYRPVKLMSLIVCTMLSVCPSRARAEDQSPWSADLTTSVFTDYMFRGFQLYDGASVQPSVGVNYDTGYGKLTGSLWMHISAQGNEQLPGFFEMDETIKYSNQFGPVSVAAGFLWYTYPDDSDDIKDTGEVFASAAYDTLLTPTLSYYRDYREYDADYYELDISHQFSIPELGDGFQMTPFAGFGFASNSKKVYADDGFVQSTIGFTLDGLKLGDVTVQPVFNYTFGVDDLLENRFWAGINLGYSL